MKKLLLIASLLLSAAGLHAQGKTTGVVNLMSGMTAKMDLDNATSTATLTFTGPSDRWIALQFGSFTNTGGMANGQDLVYYNGTTLVDAVHNGVGATPSVDGTNNWTVTSNTVSGSTRTIVATRPFNTAAAGDYTFVYSNNDIDFAYAKGASASFAMANHGGSNRGYALNKAFSCIPPSNPTASAQGFCAGATIANLTATGAGGATFNWYANATGGAALAGTTVLASTTYHVSQTVGGCESARVPVAVTITTTPQPTASTAQQFCAGATVANLSATGTASINWYNVQAGGSPLAPTAALTPGNYYVSQTQGTCESTRLTVAVTINTVNAPTTGNATQTFCAGATVSELAVNASGGATVKYYVANNATALPGSTVMADGTTYAVTQTVGQCESPAVNITVTVNAVPAAPAGADTQQFNAGETIADLEVTVVNGAVITWYVDDNGNMAEVPMTTVLADGMTYYVTQTLNGCESAAKAIVVDEVLGTEGFELKNLVAYPNPVSDVLTISNGTALDKIAVYNLLGQSVLSQKAEGNSTEVNVSGLPAGSYTVKVITAGGASASLKVMKQ
jgi:hypothetical protein